MSLARDFDHLTGPGIRESQAMLDGTCPSPTIAGVSAHFLPLGKTVPLGISTLTSERRDVPKSSGARAVDPDFVAELSGILTDAEGLVKTDPQRALDLIAKAQAIVRAQMIVRGRTTTLARPTGSLAFWQLRRTLGHMRKHLHRAIRIEDMATLCGLSAGYFSRAFKQSVGSSPQIYLGAMRVRRAQEMLLSAEASISQIAVSCGFYDQAHLCKAFRATTGQSPDAWRRQNQAPPPPGKRFG